MCLKCVCVRGKEDSRLEGGEMRALEEVDNSGCVLNMKSRGLGDPLDQKGGGKKRTEDNSDF